MSKEKERLKECLHCGLPFKYKRNNKKYCTNTCKQVAYIKRKTIVKIIVTINPIVPEKKIGFVKRIINWFRKK
jgi:hypothetical protein